MILYPASFTPHSHFSTTVTLELLICQDDIITSLQSRLDIICDEADGETGPTVTGIQEARDDAGSQEVGDVISSETPVSQIVLQSLRSVMFI